MIKLFNFSILLSRASQSLVIIVPPRKVYYYLTMNFGKKQGNYPLSSSSGNYRNTALTKIYR